MKPVLLITAIVILTAFDTASDTQTQHNSQHQFVSPVDSIREAELDQYWTELSRTVKEGDFAGYSAGYHQDAVIIFASGKDKTSVPISKALAGWKQGFQDTKDGKVNASVDFRFSQRIGDETTAHETGIFNYNTFDKEGNLTGSYPTHFEMLLVKRADQWLGLMEYQKAPATQEEWNALK